MNASWKSVPDWLVCRAAVLSVLTLMGMAAQAGAQGRAVLLLAVTGPTTATRAEIQEVTLGHGSEGWNLTIRISADAVGGSGIMDTSRVTQSRPTACVLRSSDRSLIFD